MSITAEPNVVPLCDILLVLIIIFMVITPMVQKGIDVKLPETTSDEGGVPQGLIVLTMQKDFTVKINQDPPIALNALQSRLSGLYAARSDKTIFIRAYAKVSYAKVIEMIDIAKSAGIEILGIIPEYITEEEII